MKLQTLIDLSQNTLTGYGPGFLEINRTRHSGAVLVAPEGEVVPWTPTSVESLTAADFEQILALRPEVVLLGTGARQRFAHASLSAARIGLEMMDTGAACRTYNILMAEGRKVLAALIPPTP